MSLAAIAPDVGVEGERVFPPLAGVYPRTKYSGLTTKDETILRILFLFRGSSSVGQKAHISVLGHIVNHKNTQLNKKPKIKLQIVILLEFWVVFTVLSFVGNPVYRIYH